MDPNDGGSMGASHFVGWLGMERPLHPCRFAVPSHPLLAPEKAFGASLVLMWAMGALISLRTRVVRSAYLSFFTDSNKALTDMSDIITDVTDIVPECEW